MSEPAGTHYTEQPDGKSKVVKIVLPNGDLAVYEVPVQYATDPVSIRMFGTHRAVRIAGVWYEYARGGLQKITSAASITILEQLEVVQ